MQLDALRAAHRSVQHASELLAGMLPEAVSRDVVAPPPIATLKRVVPPRSVAPVHAAVVEFEETQSRIPRRAWNRGARIIARAIGDSMDGGPDPIRNGELVYLKPTRSPRTANNQTVLVRREESLFLKKFEKSGFRIRLVGMNGEPVMHLDARADSIQIYGYVVDHAG